MPAIMVQGTAGGVGKTTRTAALCRNLRRQRRGRGHEYHPSRWRGRRGPAAWKIGPRLEGYARGNLHASYVHVHFAGAPECAERFVESARRWGGNLS